MEKTNKHFISDIDIELTKFDQDHQPSPSQQFEIEKYKAISELRDTEKSKNDKMGNIWNF